MIRDDIRKIPVINPCNDDFGAVLICALRYCIGRQTYMPRLVIDYITPLIPCLDGKTLKVMANDIRTAENYGDEVIDKPYWLMFLRKIEHEMERRKNEKA